MDVQVQAKPTGLGRAIFNWARDSVRSRGAWGTVKNFGEQFGLFIRDSFPDRQRSRFGDIDYDCDYGVDTTWARLPLRVRVRELFSERLYQPTAPAEFHSVISDVPADFSEFIFVDLGSGKGRALLLASEYSFREIIGVEVQPELHRIAQDNVARFNSSARKCNRVSTFCMDAREFEFPEEPLVIYLFNPFPDYVLEVVLKNLGQSLREDPRPAFLLYNTPWEEQVFRRFGFVHKIQERENFQLYQAIAQNS
jgi:SAM-dependent methyltransferase